jgi:UDP-N-acetylmuramyl tripeptide synthase
VLEVRLAPEHSEDVIIRWAHAVRRMTGVLGWDQVQVGVRSWRGGAELGLTAPLDQLLTATDVNEWAWADTVVALGLDAGPPELSPDATPRSFDEAVVHLGTLARLASRPALLALQQAAATHGVPFRWDDATVWLGSGRHTQAWPREALPAPNMVTWGERRAIPTALVTGSNGKTTTTRLIAAMLRAQGFATGHCCTDGVVIGTETVEAGDYSGPVGALTVLGDPRIEAAVLETARGGILRRGLVACGADLAVATNVQHDHLGEYGIDSAEAIATVKLSIAKGVRDGGWLVLNAGDEHLTTREPAVRDNVERAWFAFDPAALPRHPRRGATIEYGKLVLRKGADEIPIAAVEEIPIAVGGVARHYLENALAATLAAWCMGVPPDTIRAALVRFGLDPADNPGRLTTWRLGQVTVLTDYAHNPEGLTGLLTVARSHGPRRMILLLGQAGNRDDDAIRALAAAAWAFRPDHVVLKELETYLRGRASAEVPAVLEDELLRLGLAAAAMEMVLPEVDAARTALSRARDGDVVVLPVHGAGARAEVAALLTQLTRDGWHPGMPLPERPQS